MAKTTNSIVTIGLSAFALPAAAQDYYAGASFGFALIWALVFATVTTIILQSFAIRIALVTNMGLAQAMMASA